MNFWRSRRRRNEELDEEVRSHLAMAAEDRVAEGEPEESARVGAVREFGNVALAKEVTRQMWGWMWLETLFQDIRYGLRQLRRNPGFTLVAVLTLALGIGANTAIFSVINGVLLKPLPYHDPDRLVQIEEHHEGLQFGDFTYATFLDLASQSRRTLERVAASRFSYVNLGGDGLPERLTSARVSANFFHVLGVAPFLGRAFAPDEDQPGGANVIVLSYGLWQRRFGGDPGVLGTAVTVNDSSATIIGVMPPGFTYPGKTDVWERLFQNASLNSNRRSHLLSVVGRLTHGAGIAQARADLAVFAQQVEKQNPGVDPGLSITVGGLQQRMVGPVRPALLVLLGAVGLVLLIACANMANLALTRTTGRLREFAIRKALGAGRRRLIRQTLVESTVLALLGGAAGFLLAGRALRLIVALAPADIPRLDHVSVDFRVLAFTLGISLAAGILFGLAPALAASRSGSSEQLKEGGRGSEAPRHTRLRNAMVISEIALALVLLAGAGLLINSFTRLMRVNPGFNPDHVLTAGLFLSPSRYPEGSSRTPQFLRQVLQRIRALPGVVSAGLVSTLPLDLGPSTDLEIASHPIPTGGTEPLADIRVADPDYFRTVNIPLLKGREFNAGDGANSPRVMVISESMARRYWPGEDPLGKKVTMKDWGPPLTGVVVGVVGDVKSDGLAAEARPTLYWPYTQFPMIFNNLVIRTSGDPLALAAAVKSRVWSIDSEQAVSDIVTLNARVSQSLLPARFYTFLLGAFALLAGALAAVGIYGVVSYAVMMRTHEIGIRLALGAAKREVSAMVLRQGMSLAVVGIVIGFAGSLLVTRFLAGLLYGVTPTDPLTLAAVSAILVAVALFASYLPARRAANVDPMAALRHE